MEEVVKKGLNEQMKIGDNESKMGFKRDNPGQVPKPKTPEKASKGGKSFKIT